jgi:hypothetical protein
MLEDEQEISYPDVELDWLDNDKEKTLSNLKSKLPKLYQKYWRG